MKKIFAKQSQNLKESICNRYPKLLIIPFRPVKSNERYIQGKICATTFAKYFHHFIRALELFVNSVIPKILFSIKTVFKNTHLMRQLYGISIKIIYDETLV